MSDSTHLFARVGTVYVMAGDEKQLAPTGSLGEEVQRFEDMFDDVSNGMDTNDVATGLNEKLGSEPASVTGYRKVTSS
ncbi:MULTISPECIES: hypothetical protein [Vibrio]|uniref:hypothetical protein n=1 Tax=Vibrio TaxID=662 RepID=UPI00117D61AB|nr:MULTISPECIES: hypothetical protein [unclassified Vibrio]